MIEITKLQVFTAPDWKVKLIDLVTRLPIIKKYRNDFVGTVQRMLPQYEGTNLTGFWFRDKCYLTSFEYDPRLR